MKRKRKSGNLWVDCFQPRKPVRRKLPDPFEEAKRQIKRHICNLRRQKGMDCFSYDTLKDQVLTDLRGDL